MFGTPKPAFGQPAGTFGGFNSTTTTSPFGQNAFGKPAATGFASGSATAFGSPSGAANPFGTPASTSAGPFGQPAAQTGFGFSQNASGGLFGNATNVGGSTLFGQSTSGTQGFGAKPAGFGTFGTASAQPVGGGLFGSSNQMSSGPFGQPSTSTGTAGPFGNSSGFMSCVQQSGTYIKYAPVSGRDVFIKSGQPQNIDTHHLCITCMKEYENKSLEELRYEDYQMNRKGPSASTAFGSTAPAVSNAFGQPGASGNIFGQPAQDKPLFGQTNSTFGQSSVFGKPQTSGFGAQPATSNTFAFGSSNANQTNSLFGASKPFAPTTAPAFGAPTQGTTFRPTQPAAFSGFGQPTGSIFGSKPPENAGFGMAQTSTAPAFGSFVNAQDSIFGSKPATSGFGSTAPVFGSGTSFGTATSGAATGTAFPAFGAKPDAGTGSFGTFNAPTGTNPGLVTGLSMSGGGLFNSKPPGTNLFGPTTNQPSGGLFGSGGGLQLGGGLGGNLGTGSFNAQTGSTFGGGTGLGGFGSGGLGTTNTWGATNPTLGGGLNLGGNALSSIANPGTLGGTLNNNSGPGVHDRIITLTRTCPYGYSSLLKDISPTTEKSDDSLKPTNPAAQRAILESDKYKVTLGVTKLKVKPLHAVSKKSLFDGLEEDDPSIQKFSLKPSVKRLVLRPKPANDSTAAVDSSFTDVPSENHNGNADDISLIINEPNRSSHTPPGDSVIADVNIEKDSRQISPSIIQKRVGLDSPRGSVLKSTLNIGGSHVEVSNEDDGTSESAQSSWLTSKPLIKWPSDKQEQRSNNSTVEHLFTSKTSPFEMDKRAPLYSKSRRLYPDLSEVTEARTSVNETSIGLLDMEDKENIANPTSSDDDIVDARAHTPHPTGIKLTRPGYYTLPSLEDLTAFMKPDGKCIVPQFTIGRRGYGNVFFDCEMDVANLDLDQLVHIMNKEIIIYPDDESKPPVGEGLNRPAQVTLDCVWPIDKTTKEPITQPEKLAKMDYDGKLRRVCNKHGTRFIEYRPQTGSWVFRVPHFSKYGLSHSDEEDEGQPDSAQKPPAAQPPKDVPAQPVFKGLGGFLPGNLTNGTGGNIVNTFSDKDHNLDNMASDISFVSKLNGTSKNLAMDTSEENSMDSAALYPDIGQTSLYGSKDALSPTSQLARLENRNIHTLQLMKASFFNTDTDMDDAASITDQLVPQLSIPTKSIISLTDIPKCVSTPSIQSSRPEPPLRTDLSIKPPIVKPKSVILRYHNRVLPYSKTIAGRYGNGCYADMSIALARLLHVGWGPSTNFMALTTVDAAADKPKDGNLLALSSFVCGRKDDDYSKQLLLRLHVAGGGPPNEKNSNFKNSVENFLKICLKYSNIEDKNNNLANETCPLISPKECQMDAVKEYIQEARRLEGLNENIDYGVTPLYWRQVWSLCLALWGEHGDPDIDPKIPSGVRLLGQHNALSGWLQSVAELNSDEEMSVFTLLASNKVREACQLAQKQKDYFLAMIISQIGGEMRIRHLAAKQLGLWKETGADRFIDPVRLIIFSLIAGRARVVISADENDGPSTLNVCNGLDWIRAFALHFWYICEPVATVGDAIQEFERSFLDESRLRTMDNNGINSQEDENEEDMEYDLTKAESQDILYGRVAFPLPPYENDSDDIDDNAGVKRILDLRYQLMALRASRWKSLDSILNPASHSPDPLDHRLSWLLQQFLQSIGYSHWSERGLHNIITGFASQLEAHGMWEWSIFILQHIKDFKLRNHLVKEVVMRYAGGSENTPARDLLQQLGVPEKWIFEAEALKSKYDGNSESEAYYLTLSGHYGEAHKVIMDQLAPTAILNENSETLRRLLKPLKIVGDEGRIPDWSSGGQLLLEFLDICDEVNSLKDRDHDISYRCESLSVRLALVCSAVTKFPTTTLKHSVARCEIGARLASIGCAIAGLNSTITQSNITPLLNLLNRMDLPSDYVRKLLDKISDILMDECETVFPSEAMSNSSGEE